MPCVLLIVFLFITHNDSINDITVKDPGDGRFQLSVTFTQENSDLEYLLSYRPNPYIKFYNKTARSSVIFDLSKIYDNSTESNITLDASNMLWLMNHENCKSGVNTCYVTIFSEKGFHVDLTINSDEDKNNYPNLQLNPGKIQVKITAENYSSPFNNSHLSFGLQIFWPRPQYAQMSHIRNVVDLHIPGVFYMSRILSNRDPNVGQIFFKWPRIFLTSRNAGDNGNLVNVKYLSNESFFNSTKIGNTQMLIIPMMGEDYYQNSHYASWQFTVEFGTDGVESLTTFYAAFAVVFILPLLVLAGYLVHRRFKKKGSYEPLID